MLSRSLHKILKPNKSLVLIETSRKASDSATSAATSKAKEEFKQLKKSKDLKVRPLYLDAQATSPVDPRVLDAMLPYMTNLYGNPHSRTHAYGWESEEAVEKAREVCLPQKYHPKY